MNCQVQKRASIPSGIPLWPESRRHKRTQPALALQQMGYTNVKNYAEGFFSWKQDGLPLEETDKAPDSILYSKPIQVTDKVWSAIGVTGVPLRRIQIKLDSKSSGDPPR